VDELSHRRYHKFVSVVVDHLKSRVVWVGDGKGEQTLDGFFDELGPQRAQALTHATMDLSAPFIEVVSKRAPQAEKMFDRFHLQKLANQALDEVRREEVRRMAGTDEASAIKRSRWPLLKNPWNLTRETSSAKCNEPTGACTGRTFSKRAWPRGWITVNPSAP
jgi:transposase